MVVDGAALRGSARIVHVPIAAAPPAAGHRRRRMQLRVTTIGSPRSPAWRLLGGILRTLDVTIRAIGRNARGWRAACMSGGGHIRSESARGRRIGIGGRREAVMRVVGGRRVGVVGVARPVLQRREKRIWRAELLGWRTTAAGIASFMVAIRTGRCCVYQVWYTTYAATPYIHIL